MNIFFLKINNNNTLIGMDAFASENVTFKKDGENVIFYENDNVVGFNINNFENNLNLDPGRIILNNEICSYINNKLHISFNNKQSFFRVGKVVECEQIEGTHLSLTKVDIGDEKLNIVCGAKNVRVGLLVVVATIGVIMNDGTAIKKGNLRGNESFGMLCSKKELGIVNDIFNDEGIIELPNNYNVGEIFYDVYSNKEK